MSYRDEIFTHPYEKKFLEKYRTLFSIREIEQSITLQFFAGISLFIFFVTFSRWIYSTALTVEAYASGTHMCWPYFKECGVFNVLQTLPFGYSQTTLYMLFFAMMIIAAFFMYKKEWVLTHLILLLLFIWEFLGVFVLSSGMGANYDYYQILLTFILLFLPYKTFFLKLVLVLFYFFASTIKIDDGWILGTYFSSLQTGIPIFPDAITPIVTNLVIFMQIVGAWFLLGRNMLLQRLAFTYFVIFHLYSGILVGYRYPATVLLTLIVLFGPFYVHTKVPLTKKALGGWILAAFMLIAQFLPILIPGDHRLTLEGNKYGLYMFEANHQCLNDYTVVSNDGTEKPVHLESNSARNRCDPYRTWFYLQQACQRDTSIAHITWTFDHSINGEPFYRIVDESNACILEYKALGHNQWIKTPETGAPVIGYPVKNFYY